MSLRITEWMISPTGYLAYLIFFSKHFLNTFLFVRYPEKHTAFHTIASLVYLSIHLPYQRLIVC